MNGGKIRSDILASVSILWPVPSQDFTQLFPQDADFIGLLEESGQCQTSVAFQYVILAVAANRDDFDIAVDPLQFPTGFRPV